MPEVNTVGERLREVRKRRGLSQQDLAELSGVSVSLIRKLEQGEREDARVETLRKLAEALRVPTTSLMPHRDDGDKAYPDVAADWEPVRSALAGRMPPPEQEPTPAGVRDAMHSLAPALAAHQYAALPGALAAVLRDADALGPPERQLRSSVLTTAGYLLTQTRQFGVAEMTLSRAIDTAADRYAAAAAADTMVWLYLRQGQLERALRYASRWADDIEPRFSRATVLELVLWGRFLLDLTNAAVRDNRPGEAEDALHLAAAAAARIGREVRRHDNSQCVFGPVTVAYIRAESYVLTEQPDKCLAVAGSLPAPAEVPYPGLVSRLRHRLDMANAHVQLHDCDRAMGLMREVRQVAPQWLVQQQYARDIMSAMASHRRTLTPEMRDMADFVRLPL